MCIRDSSIAMDIEERAAEEADRAVYTFTFSDTGIGINPEFVDKIFDAFSREYDSRMEQAEGTGLGTVSYTHLPRTASVLFS